MSGCAATPISTLPRAAPYRARPIAKRNVYNDPGLAAEAALACLAQGFDAVKFDPAGPYTAFGGHQPRQSDIDLSIRMVAAVRDAVGRRADILFGTHGQFTPSGAIRMARALEPYDPLWFEEPVPPDSPRSHGAGRTWNHDPHRHGGKTHHEV